VRRAESETARFCGTSTCVANETLGQARLVVST
jgi:hypothetical protein